MSDKKSFIVYGEIEETLNELSDEQVAQLFRGMVKYANTGENPEFKGVMKLVFIPIKQSMDRNESKWEQIRTKRAEAGRKGGLSSGKARNQKKFKNEANEANEANASSLRTSDCKGSTRVPVEANEANEAVNVNVNGNVNVNVNDNVNVSEQMSDDISRSSLSYLNQKVGTRYNLTENVKARIETLLSQGYTEADIRTVIDKKCAEWLPEEKMRAFLRPSTLFGEKFGEYLGAPLSGKAAEKRLEAEKKEQARRGKEEQQRREAELDRRWLEEHKEQLEEVRIRYGIGG